MREVYLTFWEKFEEELRALRSSSARLDDLLFRGQEDAAWSLRTTIERRGKFSPNISEYFRVINIIKPQVESFTGIEWDVHNYEEGALRGNLMVGELPGRNYMLYLRHHGFPSPLLDWSGSPYVAAYFAFSAPSTSDRAIYAYSEMSTTGKARSSRQSEIYSIGPSVRGHKRHFLQKSQYTICVKCHQDLGSGQKEWHFAQHDDVFARDQAEQDIITKYILPSTERVKILKLLDDFNLNAFSLFGSEESLMETMAIREFDLAGWIGSF